MEGEWANQSEVNGSTNGRREMSEVKIKEESLRGSSLFVLTLGVLKA